MKCVYVISPGESGPVKIGHASDLEGRLSSVQAGCWEKLSVFYAQHFYKNQKGSVSPGMMIAGADVTARFLEKSSHKALKAEGSHLRGEWFDIDVYEAIHLIERLAGQSHLDPVCAEKMQEYVSLYGGIVHKGRETELGRMIRSMDFAKVSMSKLNRKATSC